MATAPASGQAQNGTPTPSATFSRATKPAKKNLPTWVEEQHVEGLLVFDEARFGLKIWLRRRWCPKGVRPPWVVQDRYEWVWLYAAIEPRTGRAVFLLLPSMRQECLQVFCDHVAEQFGQQRMGMILDNAPSHRSHEVHWPSDLVPLPLPAYSPELNPAEQLFRVLRQRLSNRLFASLDDLQEALIEHLQQFWEHPEVLVQLTAYPWLIQALPAS